MQGKRIDRDMVTNLMDRLGFFNRFTMGEKKRLVQFYRHITIFKPGEPIIEEGGTGTSFFIILSGSAIVTKGDDLRPITKLGPGDFFGEISFIKGTPRTATVVPVEEVILIKVDDTMFEQLNPSMREKIKDNIVDKLIERLNNMNKMFMSMSV